MEGGGAGLVAGAEQHGVVSVPAEGAVPAGVRAVVHVVRARVGGGGVRRGVGVTRAALSSENRVTTLLLLWACDRDQTC